MTEAAYTDKYLKLPCPACFAEVGHFCTAPTNDGRRDVKWYHLAREDAADEQ